MSKLTYYIIHCLATPEGKEFTAKQVRDWHTLAPPNGRGWKVPGYSKILHLDGSWSILVPNDDNGWIDPRELTNGAVGINSISKHIAYVGGMTSDMKKPKDTRTEKQLQWMLQDIKEMILKNADIQVGGHNQFSEKACPSFDVPAWLRSSGISEKNICSRKILYKL